MNEQEERKIANNYEQRLLNEATKLIDSYSGDIKEYLKSLHSNRYTAYTAVGNTNFCIRLKKYLETPGTKPSDFFRNEMVNMKGYLSKQLLDDFYQTIDAVTEWQISSSEYRRSFRSKDYRFYTGKISQILWEYHRISQIGENIIDMITGNVTGDAALYFKYNYYSSISDTVIAIRLNNHDAELEKTLTDIIYDNTGKLGTNIIRGIIMSHNEKMYEALGKLLLAARLQEGLRQAICESMDCGTKEAFLYLFNIIMENDLIRFSSVMRAAGTWTGILTLEVKDLDRISKKQIANIGTFLSDEAARKSALESEDSMDIFLALWSYAFEEFKDGLNQAFSLVMNGTKHQRLTACYFIRHADIPSGVHPACGGIIEKFYDDPQTMAIIFTGFMSSVNSGIYDTVKDIRGSWNVKDDPSKIYHRVYADYTEYFKTEKACRKYYDIMMTMLKGIPKKCLDFEKLVFNWNHVSLTKNDIVIRLAYCASALKDETLIDEVTAYLDSVGDSYTSRSNVLALLCTAPVTQAQKTCLVKAVANAETSTREMAMKLVKQLDLNEEDYLLLEDMLRLKKSDVRKNVIDLMKNRPAADKLPMIERLLNNNKEEKRTAGLDILNTMKMQDEVSEEEAKSLVSCIVEPTTKEKILINEICKSESEDASSQKGFGLFDESADYEPVLEGEYLNECVSLYKKCFPQSTAFATFKPAVSVADTAVSMADATVSTSDTAISMADSMTDTDASSTFDNSTTAYDLVNSDASHSTSTDDAITDDLFKNIGRELEFLKKLEEIIEANKLLEYKTSWGDVRLLGNGIGYEYDENNKPHLAFSELWEGFVKETNCTAVDLLRMKMMLTRNASPKEYADFCEPILIELLGNDLMTSPTLSHYQTSLTIVTDLLSKYCSRKLRGELSVATIYYLITTEKELSITYEEERWGSKYKNTKSIFSYGKLSDIICLNASPNHFSFKYAIAKRIDFRYDIDNTNTISSFIPNTCDYIRAYTNGLISKDFMYKMIINLNDCLHTLSTLIKYIRDSGRTITGKGTGSWKNRQAKSLAENLVGHKLPETFSLTAKAEVSDNPAASAKDSGNESVQNSNGNSTDSSAKDSENESLQNSNDNSADSSAKDLVKDLTNEPANKRIPDNGFITEKDIFRLTTAEECYEKISFLVLDTELVRGDTETMFSNRIFSLERIYGAKYFVRILSALGKETLIRSGYFNYYSGRNNVSKQESLSHLLQCCIPDMRDGESPQEQSKLLKSLLKGTDITDTRLIEAAMYSPEWIEIVGEYLGWSGFMSCCYYFMAHMNEHFDDKRMAMIAKYTPLSSEELNDGAFDLKWFTEVYNELGHKHFDTIYKAAKYISDGSKHSRARKYADAAIGKLDQMTTEEQIKDKRNKDLLMAYSIIPVKSDAVYKEKYMFLQQFLKESRQFGAQRRASEKKATEIAIKNLATASGVTDETRFILRMEGEIASELIGYFTPAQIEDVTIYLTAGDLGKVSVVCEKGGKTLKSIPAKIKKNEYVVSLSDAKKTLTEQYRRTKKMFEESMEEEAVFTVKELLEMRKSPAVSGLIDNLIFKQASDDAFGFLSDFYPIDNTGTNNPDSKNNAKNNDANNGKNNGSSVDASDSTNGSEMENISKYDITDGSEMENISKKNITSNSENANASKHKISDMNTELLIAHPYHLYKADVWHTYQQIIFDRKIKQPFKQVFRELYVKTSEEKDSSRSLRYAGNQIQPTKTVACLKDRRWIADVEDGLQKVYYKENIIACIYALADWFSPADIEAPTLEWVVFYDRKTYKEIKIKDIPDILFSEVMRDVDLAVSVAHAGGIDPEMSHSTVEMRHAIAEFTMPLFKLHNVSFTDTHAIIEGKKAKYTIHLGSGVIHKMGGPMINVLPVHSQHRGKIFLPFVDDDPKTAEIISKIVMFAEDDKIKDPFILEQI